MEEREQIGKPLHDLIEIIHFTENVSAKIHGLLDEAEIYKTLKEEFAKSKRYTVTVLLLTDEGSKLRIAITTTVSRKLKAAERATGLRMEEYYIDLDKSSIFNQVVRGGETLNVNFSDLISEMFPQPLSYLITKILRYGKRRSILTPLYRHGKIIGAFGMTSTDLAEYFISSVKNLARHISAALELADENAERKPIEETLRESEGKFRSIFENASDCMIYLDGTGRILDANKKAVAVFGGSKEEVLGKHFMRINAISLKDMPSLMSAFANGLLGKHPTLNIRIKNKKGEEIPLECSGSLTKIDDRPTLLVIARDITERKRAEEELARLSGAVRMSTDSIVISGIDGKIIDLNEATLRMYGTDDKRDLIGKNSFDLMAPEDREKALAGMKEVLEKGYIKGREYHVVIKDHSRIPVEMSVAIMKDADGKPMGFVGISRDITERKKMEEALGESEEKYRTQFEEALDAIFVGDAETGTIVDCNHAASELVGREKSELVGKHQRILHPPEEIDGGFSRTFKQHLKEQEGQVLETQVITKRGVIKDVAIKANVFELRGKKLIQGIFRDITERKQTEEELAHERDLLQSLMDSIPDTIYFKDVNSRFTRVNKAQAQVLGVRHPEEAIGKTDFDFFTEEHARDAYADEQRIVESGQPLIGKAEKIRRADGQSRWVSSTKVPIVNREGSITGIVGISRDITEWKMAEDRVRESEEKYRNLFENARDVILTIDLKGNVTSINKAVARFGFKEEEVVGNSMLKFVPRKYWPRLLEDLAETYRGEAVRGEVVISTPTGKRLVDYSATPLRLKEEVVGIQAILRDITERKKIEEDLRASEERARNLLEFQSKVIDTAVVWIDLLDKEGNVTLWNRAAELISGFSRQDVVGHRKIWEWLYPDTKYRAQVFGKAREIIEKGARVENYESVIRCKDGALKTISWHSNNIVDGKGMPTGSIAVGIDITERKRMEEELAHERDLLQTLIDNIPDSVFFKDTSCRLMMVNRAAAKCTPGISDLKELMGKTDFDTHPKELAAQYYADDQAIIQSGQAVVEKEEPSFDGRWLSTTKVPIKDKAGKVTGIVGIARDVTERKRAEEALRRSAERLEALHRHAIELDKADTVKDIAKSTFNAIEKSLGFNAGSFGVVEGGLLRFIHLHGLDTGQTIEMPVDGAGVTVRAVRTGETQLVPDTRVDKDYVWLMKGVPESLSELVAPVKIGEEVVAVINLESTESNGFNKEDRKLLEILAMHVASAISRLRRVEKLEELIEQRTRDLRKAERLAAIGETAAMVGHDLRNPLQVIVNTVYSAKKSQKFLPPEGTGFARQHSVERLLRTVEEQIEYMNKIVSDLQDYARPLKPDLNETNLRRLIDETLSTIAFPESVKVSVAIEESFPDLMVDGALMKRVFTNLVTNALQAMPNGGELTVRAFASETEQTASVSVEDTGVGISEEDQSKLFQPLFTTKPKGTGFGLPVCKRLIEAHEGAILVESQVGKGSTFTVKIPLGRR